MCVAMCEGMRERNRALCSIRSAGDFSSQHKKEKSCLKQRDLTKSMLMSECAPKRVKSHRFQWNSRSAVRCECVSLYGN